MAQQIQKSNKQTKETIMNQTTKRILFSVMAVIFLLAACAPAPAATQDPALVQQLIEQSVALTVAAQNAQTLEAQALIPAATNTPLPTQTEVAPPAPALPTATPFVIVPPTVAPVTGGGGGVTTTKPEFACDIIHQRPFDDTSFKPGDTFDVKWTIVNTGTRTWRKGLDLKYLSGPKMTSTANIELPEMKPGDQFNVVLDATAPTDSGTQVMVWVIEGQICYPYVRIIVNK
jgi:Ig-like domain-containing protein